MTNPIPLAMAIFVPLLSLSVVCAQDQTSATNEFAADFCPDQSALPVAAPEDAIILFDGKSINRFRSMVGDAINWPVKDGTLVSTPGNARTNHIVSILHFRDADLHVEFQLPQQGSGNSGVYIHGNYELQIFNSFGKEEPAMADAGAIYGFSPPITNACRAPGQWQVVDIRYRAPRRDKAGRIVEEGVATAWLNGKKVQDKTVLGEPRSRWHPYRYGATPYLEAIWQRQLQTSVGPLFLQDHDNPVRFRNVWVRPLDDQAFWYGPESEEGRAPRG